MGFLAWKAQSYCNAIERVFHSTLIPQSIHKIKGEGERSVVRFRVFLQTEVQIFTGILKIARNHAMRHFYFALPRLPKLLL